MKKYISLAICVSIFLWLGFGRETVFVPYIGAILAGLSNNLAFTQQATAQTPLVMLLGFVDTLIFLFFYDFVLVLIIYLLFDRKTYFQWVVGGIVIWNLLCFASVLAAKSTTSQTLYQLSKDIQYAYFSPMPLMLLAGLRLLLPTTHVK